MLGRLLITCLTLGISILSCAASPSSKPSESISYRLPEDIQPDYYRLEILTNLADLNENFTFEGRVWIQMKCKAATDRIILHSKNLTVHEKQVKVFLHNNEFSDFESVSKLSDEPKEDCKDKCTGQSAVPLKIADHSYHEDFDLYIITLTEKLSPGLMYSVLIPYDGVLTQGLAGYYRSSYKDLKSNETKWMTVTQFESTDARRAFPCFDEPGFKAKFQVNLGHIKNRTSISNMPISTTEPIEGMKDWVWDRYQMTVPMSTYLLAFIVSDFEYKTAPSSKTNNVKFRVWARKDAIDQVDYSTTVGPQVLEFYEKYFDVKYPLPKQDMIAIPDFSSGAMENWGLITFREIALLYDPKISTASIQPFVASVVAHELAHQWFGNLVTMKWWTDLWLNEGFATYVAALGVHHIHPEWNSLDEEVVDNMVSVFSLDSLKSSHPISVPIGHPREIAQIFDTISYKKGSSVLRMMNLFLGEDTFRNGVTNYLKKHAYGNAEQDDLWDSLTEEAHETGALPKNITVKEIMDTWTLQTGYPLITVTRDYDKGTASIIQKRYLGDQTALKDGDPTSWWIPLSYTHESEADFNKTEPREWMQSTDKEIVITGLPNNEWVIFNIQMAGIYKVKYDVENWNRLIKTLNSEDYHKIGLLNRVQLIDDSLDLGKTGDIDYSIPFRIIKYLGRETEYLPWKTALRNLGHVDKQLRYYPIYGAFRSFMRHLLTPVYERVSKIEYEDKPANLHKIKHQTLIAAWSCKYGVGDCKAKAVETFADWMSKESPDKENPIPKDSRSYTFCTAIKYGGEEEWDFLWKRYLNSNVGNERSMILSALSCTREVWLLNRYLEWSLNENSGIRRQDSKSVFAGIGRGEVGYFLAKSFLKTRITDIYNYFGPKTTRLSSYINVLSSQVTTENELSELAEFTSKHEKYFQNSQQAVQQGLENAKINIQWQNQFYKGLERFLTPEE